MTPARTSATVQKCNGVLWALIVVYAASRFLQVFPLVPMLAVVIRHVVPPALFALLHGARLYGLRGILVFVAVCLAVGNIFENLGVRTGFPFGHYYFTNVMGPKFLIVPVFLGLAYVGVAYLSWTLARIILREAQSTPSGSRLVTLPLFASCIMVSWDLSMDPIWSTIVRAWIWLNGGRYFGVPLSNFAGWFLTVFAFYQLFALYLRARPTRAESSRPADTMPVSYWSLPVIFYAVCAAGNLLFLIPQPGQLAPVCDPAGAQWKVSTIVGACAFVSVCTMGSFSLFAWLQRRSPSDTRLGEVSASYATQ